MNKWFKIALMSFLFSVVVMGIYTWPLPVYFNTAISASPDNPPDEPPRYMIPGDHLQLLYRLWLSSDYFTGQTPFYHNLYEFNTGDDAERWFPSVHHFPFSVPYRIGEELVSHAFGWNITIFIATWMSCFFTWLLVRRHTRSHAIAACCALVAILFPYRWHAYLAGSPTGFAMMWPPIIWWGLDVVWEGRNKKHTLIGGFFAGLGILGTAWCDSHVIYFTLLYLPIAFVIFILRFGGSHWRGLRQRRIPWATLLGLLLIAIALGLTMQYVMAKQHILTETTDFKGGHTLAMLQQNSDHWKSMFVFTTDHYNRVYLGFLPVALFALGVITLLWQAFRKKMSCSFGIIFGVLILCVTATVLIGWGYKGPDLFDGKVDFNPFEWIRKQIPKYDKMRQASKNFSYFTVFYPLFLGYLLYAWQFHKRRWLQGLICLALPLIVLDFQRIFNPRLCLLEEHQAAYETIRNDADRRGVLPRAVAIPFWPGNDAHSSIYQYHASLYRIRMVNGYHPVVNRKYKEVLYEDMKILNAGRLTDEHIHYFLDRGIDYLLYYEKEHPRKVSTFPSGYVLNAFLEDPHLELLAQEHGVWAFRIRKEPIEKKERYAFSDFVLSNRNIEAEKCHVVRGSLVTDLQDASQNKAVRFSNEQQEPKMFLKGFTLPSNKEVYLLLRVKGNGSFFVRAKRDNYWFVNQTIHVHDEDWVWKRVDFNNEMKTSGLLTVMFEGIEGDLLFDELIYGKGPWPEWKPGTSIYIPAMSFTREAGTTDLSDGSLHYLPDRDRLGYQSMFSNLYPLEPGLYEFNLEYDSPTPEPGTNFVFGIHKDTGVINQKKILNGEPARFRSYIRLNTLPRFFMSYQRQIPLQIKGLEIKRVL